MPSYVILLTPWCSIVFLQEMPGFGPRGASLRDRAGKFVGPLYYESIRISSKNASSYASTGISSKNMNQYAFALVTPVASRAVTNIYIYTYIYVCICIFVCVCITSPYIKIPLCRGTPIWNEGEDGIRHWWMTARKQWKQTIESKQLILYFMSETIGI